MNQPSPVGFALKAAALLVYDVIICLLFFSVWTILNLPLLPWAILAVFGSLVLLNGAVLLSGLMNKSLGLPFTASVMIATILYSLVIVGFTWLNYPIIKPKWYVILTLVFFLIYLAVMTGLYMSARSKRGEITGQETEKQSSGNLSLLLLSIDSNLQNQQNQLAPGLLQPASQAFSRLRERMQASTPFGRVTRPEIASLENYILTELGQINAWIQTINAPEGVTGLAASFNRIYDVVVKKEKMIVQ